MTILSDFEIKQQLRQHPATISDFPPPFQPATLPLSEPPWDTKESPIQPCSVDLHIGQIFVPGVPEDCLGSSSNPQYSLTLESGMSVVVMSHELLDLPPDIGAIALPPSRISSAGILIANFGHIDPGYRGHLRFTLINMGKEPFPLRQRALVMTLLLFRVARVGTPFAARETPRADDSPTHSEVNRLARDFANVEERSGAVAKDIVNRAKMGELVYKGAISAILSSVGIIVAAFAGFKIWLESDIKRIDVLEKERAVLQERVGQLDRRLTDERAFESELRRLGTELEKVKSGTNARQ